RPADEPQQKVRALEPLLEPVLLVSEPCAPVLELRELRGDRVEAAAPLRKGRVAKKRALALFSLQLEIIRELIESLGRGIPQVPQLKIDHRIRGRQRIDQQPLESFELLSRASDRRFLLLELVEQLVPLAPQVAELALHGRAIPIQLEQLLVGTPRRLTRLEESQNHG